LKKNDFAYGYLVSGKKTKICDTNKASQNVKRNIQLISQFLFTEVQKRKKKKQKQKRKRKKKKQEEEEKEKEIFFKFILDAPTEKAIVNFQFNVTATEMKYASKKKEVTERFLYCW
jgi:hypothetical protein